MKALSLCFLLLTCFSPSPLIAQAEEIAEINTETLQENWLQQLYKELDTGNKLNSAQARLRLDQYRFNALLSLQNNLPDLKLNTNLYWEKDRPVLGSFTLSRFTQKSGLNQLQLGNISPAWGSGLVFKPSSAKDRLTNLKPAPHPLHYSPLGVAGTYTYKDLSAFGLASYQKRSADLLAGKIKKIHSSRQPDLAKVEETITAAGLEYHPQDWVVGLLLYQQVYGNEFLAGEYTRKLQAATLSTKLRGNPVQLGAEAGLSAGNLALRLKADLLLPRLEQSFGFSYSEANQFPAYAARPSILSSYGQRHELTWDLDYEPYKLLKLGFRQAISRPNHSIQSAKWLSRNTFYLQAKPQPTDILLQLTRLDREIVALEDSSYLYTRPVHYRFKTQITQHFNPHFQFLLQFRYYYENKQAWTSNSLYWENALQYTCKKFSIKGGIQTWQGLRSITLPDENSDSPEGANLVSSDGGKFYLNTALRYKTLRFTAELQKTWNKNQQSIYISLGI